MSFLFNLNEDLDPIGDPYGVISEPEDPEAVLADRCAELRARYPERWTWFQNKAKTANRRAPRRGGGRIDAGDVASAFDATGGRCHYCGSLADQQQGYNEPWAGRGHLIGTIDHVATDGIPHPGADPDDEYDRHTRIWNCSDNLVWCCMQCNTYPSQRPLAV